jgi:hypothetical protein
MYVAKRIFKYLKDEVTIAKRSALTTINLFAFKFRKKNPNYSLQV